MSAEILRRAADQMRFDQDIEENLGHIDMPTLQAWRAVADWLESVHVNLDTYNANRTEVHHAFDVARAYLGEDR